MRKGYRQRLGSLAILGPCAVDISVDIQMGDGAFPTPAAPAASCSFRMLPANGLPARFLYSDSSMKRPMLHSKFMHRIES